MPEFFGNIDSNGEFDDFAVTLTAGVTYYIELEGSESAQGTLVDPLVQLFDSSGGAPFDLLDSDNDGGFGLNSRLIFTASVSGQYFVRASEFGDNASGTYRLRVNPDDRRSTIDGVGAVSSVTVDGGGTTGSIDYNGDRDLIEVNLTGGTLYFFDLAGSETGAGSLADPLLRVLNGSGVEVISDDDSGDGFNARLTFTPTTSGIYYISAQDYGKGVGTFTAFVSTGATDGNDTIVGTAGAETISGLGGDDTLSGLEGNDTLNGGAGDDTLSGGAGSDTASYAGISGPVVVDLRIAGQQDTISAGIDSLISIESLLGSTFDDVLAGNNSANTVAGGAGNDTIIAAQGNDIVDGGDGDDSLGGGGGDDTVTGGGGTDVATYAGNTGGVTVNLAILGAQNTVTAGIDTLSGVENLIGGDGADTLTGDGLANRLTGGLGADLLDGASGNDTLDGGAGNDGLNGGDGIDTADFSLAGGGVSVDLQLGGAQDTFGAGLDTLTSIENLIGSSFADLLAGSSGNNTLTGGLGADTINAGQGNDIVDGGDGDDTLGGGGGDDTLAGGTGIDTATYAGNVAGVTVNLATLGTQNTVSAGIDRLGGIENLIGGEGGDVLSGNGAANVLTGGNGNDNLIGAAGNDLLIGGSGQDVMNGGGGADDFDFNAIAETGATQATADRIQGFMAGLDDIDLSTIDANGAAAGDPAFQFINTAGFTAVGQVRFFQAGGNTFVEINNVGVAGTDAVIRLDGSIALTAGDFIL